MSINAPFVRRQAFSPSCPSGGTFYACQEEKSSFVGCCTADACSNGCSDGNLKPASFEPSYYGKFQDQECPSGSQWFTCAYTKPPFMGCCKSKNPCTNGCQPNDLTAAFLSSNPKENADFISSKPAESSSTPPPTSTALTNEASKTLTAATMTTAAHPTEHPSKGTIAGSIFGGIAAMAIILALLALRFRRKAAFSRQQAAFSRAEVQRAEKQIADNRDVKHESEAAPLSRDVEKYERQQSTPELMSTPAPSYRSRHSASELDGANPMQRAIPISSEPLFEHPSPDLSQFSSDSPRLHQSWGNGR